MAHQWVHFIGKSYYNDKDAFIAEAEGPSQVSRRVSIEGLGSFNWGDVIWVGQGDPLRPNKPIAKGFDGSRIFGHFVIDRLSGLSHEAIDLLTQKFGIVQFESPMDGMEVERGCGGYTILLTYACTASLPAVAAELKTLKRSGVNIGSILLAGHFVKLQTVAHLPNYGFRMGYKRFEDFRTAYIGNLNVVQAARLHNADTSPLAEITFEFTPVDGMGPASEPEPNGEVQEVAGYTLK